jgi:crotonobetainyl-CoA:carnitine CoA-transferase CaiB-like acyl-CoA transferase
VPHSPLQGLRVVEMTEALAGPYCAMLLGDLGADVVKIERRGSGDQSRGWGPPFLDGESAYYLAVNRNKRSVALDIKDAKDLGVLHALVGQADVFITNNPRLDSLRRAKLDPDTLRGNNPRLVYAGISGYGHSGPKANRGGYDIIAQGEAGLMALTGEPEGGPNRFPTPMADISGGIYAMIGILSALYARDAQPEMHGEGQFLDIALVDAQMTWLANVGGSYFATGQRPPRMGNEHPTITPYQPVRARDKHMIVAVGNERLWQRFCEVLGITETLMRDPRFATNAQRNANRQILVSLLEEILMRRDAAEWIDALVAVGIPCGPINFPDDTLEDPHTAARDMIVELEHPAIGTIRSIGFPVQFSATGPSYRRYPPRLGEHNEEILREIGTETLPSGT